MEFQEVIEKKNEITGVTKEKIEHPVPNIFLFVPWIPESTGSTGVFLWYFLWYFWCFYFIIKIQSTNDFVHIFYDIHLVISIKFE